MKEDIKKKEEEMAKMKSKKNERSKSSSKRKSRVVVYKRGANGCSTFSNEGHFDTPIFPVIALKPTGAGDGFMGGFISGLVAGAPLEDAVRRGAATAAIVVTRVGCAPAMPSTNEVHAFMQQAKS